MKSRKTIEVSKVVDMANKMLANEDISQQEKSGIACLLEEVLHATNQYQGFNSLYWLTVGYKKWVEAGKPDFPEKHKFLGQEWDRHYYGGGNVKQETNPEVLFPLRSLAGI
jgi:hypothetical protein